MGLDCVSVRANRRRAASTSTPCRPVTCPAHPMNASPPPTVSKASGLGFSQKSRPD